MRIRSKAREIALCMLYEAEISGQEHTRLIDAYFLTYPQKIEAKEFCTELVAGVLSHTQRLDEIIKKCVKNWEIGRMAVVDRNILRMASFELMFLKDIPPKVSINEAVELAKKFGDVDSPRFVNGIIDKIYKSTSPEPLAGTNDTP